MALPVTSLSPPNTVCEIQPGMVVQAVCAISPPSGAVLATAAGGPNASVSIQPGMNVRAIVWVTSSGAFTTPA